MFRCSLTLAVLLSSAPSLTFAQRVSPAAVTRLSARRVEIPRARTDSSPSLSHDIKRGATVGAITGAVIGAIGVAGYVWASSGSVCCEQAPRHVHVGDIITISAASTVAGGLVGAVLGYGYHFNRPTTK